MAPNAGGERGSDIGPKTATGKQGAYDLEWNQKVHRELILPDPPTWTAAIIRRVNDLSTDSLIGAIEKGRKIDFWLRNKKITLSQDALDAAGLHLPVGSVKKYLALVRHKSNCEEAPCYRTRQAYGTNDGEDVIVDLIRQLQRDNISHREVARRLTRDGRGVWTHQKVGDVIKLAEQGAKPRMPCTCRMYRTNWIKPKKWSVCYEVLMLPDSIFEAMLAKGGINRHTTIGNIDDFKLSRLPHQSHSLPPTRKAERRGTLLLNQVIHGDCLDLIPLLTENTVAAVITSPPYAQQRDQYEGIPEAQYPQWMANVMAALYPKVKDDGSVLLVIGNHLKDGRESDYVRRTIDAVEAKGWRLVQPLIWHKPDAAPLGAIHRYRPAFEPILWFAKIEQPYLNLRVCGRPSKRIGLQTKNRHGNINGTSEPVEGIARPTNVITVNAGSVDRGIDHPAMFPRELVRRIHLPHAPLRPEMG